MGPELGARTWQDRSRWPAGPRVRNLVHKPGRHAEKTALALISLDRLGPPVQLRRTGSNGRSLDAPKVISRRHELERPAALSEHSWHSSADAPRCWKSRTAP